MCQGAGSLWMDFQDFPPEREEKLQHKVIVSLQTWALECLSLNAAAKTLNLLINCNKITELKVTGDTHDSDALGNPCEKQ